MVRAWGLALGLLAAGQLCAAEPLALSATAAAPLSATAEGLPALPARPAPLQREPNVRWETFAATTIVSLPFTAFWALIGALIVGGVAQKRFPPEFDQPLLTGAAVAAGAASLSVGLISVNWGGSKAATTAVSATARP